MTPEQIAGRMPAAKPSTYLDRSAGEVEDPIALLYDYRTAWHLLKLIAAWDQDATGRDWFKHIRPALEQFFAGSGIGCES